MEVDDDGLPIIKEEEEDLDLTEPAQLRIVERAIKLSDLPEFPNPFESTEFQHAFLMGGAVIVTGAPGIGHFLFSLSSNSADPLHNRQDTLSRCNLSLARQGRPSDPVYGRG